LQRRSELTKKFETSRKNLLWVAIFSVVNILLMLLRANITFLFSASFPVLVIELGQILSEELGYSPLLLIAAIISFVSISLYAVCYFLAKKHRVFILVALILFSIDTLFLIWIITLGFELSILLDVAFHIWILYYLITGTRTWAVLRKLPPDEEIEEDGNEMPLVQPPA